MTQSTYQLSGMHCGSCVDKITNALAPLAEHVAVSLHPQQVVVKNANVDLAQLQSAVAAAGKYSLVPMSEVSATVAQAASFDESNSWFATYRPLLLLVGYIGVASVLIQVGLGRPVAAHETMRYFMAGSFGAFSFFKLINLREFASAYARYDVLAGAWPGWGFVYPFVEAVLGIAHLSNWMPMATNTVTFIVMAFSSLGVIRAVANKSKLQCACLGSVLKLPMGTVTIIEDLGMAAMAGFALFTGHR